MESQGQSIQRAGKPHWIVIVLATISTLTALTYFAIGGSFFIAVGLGLEGPFRLRFFWFPMPWWLFHAVLVTALVNSIWMIIIRVASVFQTRKRKKISEAQENSTPAWSPTRWQKIWLIWCASILFLSSVSPLLLDGPSSFTPKGKTELVSVAMVSPTEGWAVGKFEGSQPEDALCCGVIWHYHDGTWTQVVQLADEYLNGVAALPDGEAWAVGEDHTILHEQKGIWTLVYKDSHTLTFEDFSKVAMVSSTEGWAVGSSFTQKGLCGFIWHYSHGKWALAFQVENANLWNISALPNGEAWAVGDGGLILQERGGVWKRVANLTPQVLYGIDMVSPTEGWAVGVQTLLHYYNGKWTLFPLNTTDDLRSIKMTSSSEGWITTARGNILHYTRGSWQQVHSPTSQILSDIALVPGTSSESWVVGQGLVSDTNTIPSPTILHMRNNIWGAYIM